MHLARYKSVLALPGMRGFMLVSLIARIPGTAWTTALTLSIVLDRHRSYAEAGAATAAFTIGLALGSPLLGRAIDRRGPRPVLLLTGTVSLLFWNLVPSVPYTALLPLAVFAGALQVPVMTLVRQSLHAAVAMWNTGDVVPGCYGCRRRFEAKALTGTGAPEVAAGWIRSGTGSQRSARGRKPVYPGGALGSPDTTSVL